MGGSNPIVVLGWILCSFPMWSDPAAIPSVRALCVVVRDSAHCGPGAVPESAVLSFGRGAQDCAIKMPAIASGLAEARPLHDAPEPAAQSAYDGAAGAWRGERAAGLKLSSSNLKLPDSIESSYARNFGADSAQWLVRSNLKVRMRHATNKYGIKSGVPQTKQL